MTHEPADLKKYLDVGALSALDVHVAATLGRLGGERDATVLLAAALACRAPGLGHVCVDLAGLASPGPQAFGGPDAIAWPELAPWLARLAASPLVAVDGAAGRPLVLDGTCLFLQRYWGYQCRLAAALRRRAAVAHAGVDRGVLKASLTRLFPRDSWPTASPPRQAVAAALAALRHLTVISGGPGTGKTSTIKRILVALLDQDDVGQRGRPDGAAPAVRIALAAPTGKAAVRLVHALHDDLAHLPASDAIKAQLPTRAWTLHRLLGFQRRSPSRFRHDAGHPLPYDIVIVDEASMVDVGMMARLVEAVPAAARLILLGDRDQLASVQAGAVLADLCGDERGLRLSAGVSVEVEALLGAPLLRVGADGAGGLGDCLVHLDHFHRFGADSGIGALARTLTGLADPPLADAGQSANAWRADRTLDLLEGRSVPQFLDLSRVEPMDGGLGESLGRIVVAHYAEVARLAQAGHADQALDRLDDLGVLCAHREGPLSVAALNTEVAAALQRGGLIPQGHSGGGWYPGQPVLITENDAATGLMNGDVGVVALAPDGSRRAWFRVADGALLSLSPPRLPAHATCFALTIHKSQGSQYRHAVVVLPPHVSPIVTRELLYTGLTRASERVTVVASAAVVRAAVLTQVTRASGLAAALSKQDVGDVVGPSPPAQDPSRRIRVGTAGPGR